jgi:hypothetical protein
MRPHSLPRFNGCGNCAVIEIGFGFASGEKAAFELLFLFKASFDFGWLYLRSR